MCRFSDAGKTCSPRAHAAGVRKAPRHEIAVCRAPGVAATAMGIWAGRACPCDLMAAVRMIALGLCAGFRTPARRALHALMRPASEKRQGTKSRCVGHPAWQRALWGFGRVVRARAI